MEREITSPVDLCLPDGTLNREAVGWTRHPLHRTNLRGWGRSKRWEYWCVQAPGVVQERPAGLPLGMISAQCVGEDGRIHQNCSAHA